MDTYIKTEDPDDFCSDKPVPKYWFGDRVHHPQTGRTGEIIGLYWRHNKEWFYSLDYTGDGWGQWIAENKLQSLSSVKQKLH